MSGLIAIPARRGNLAGQAWIDPTDVGAQTRALLASLEGAAALSRLRGLRPPQPAGFLRRPTTQPAPELPTTWQRLMTWRPETLNPQPLPNLNRLSWDAHQGRVLSMHAAMLQRWTPPPTPATPRHSATPPWSSEPSIHDAQLRADLISAAQLAQAFNYRHLEVPALRAGACVLTALILGAQLCPARPLRLPGALLELAARASVVFGHWPRALSLGGELSAICAATQTLCLQALGEVLTHGDDLTRLQQHGQLRDHFEELHLNSAHTLAGHDWLRGAPLGYSEEDSGAWLEAPVPTDWPEALTQTAAEHGPLLPLPEHAIHTWSSTLCPGGACAPEQARLALRLWGGDPDLMAQAGQHPNNSLWTEKTSSTPVFPTWLHSSLATTRQWPGHQQGAQS